MTAYAVILYVEFPFSKAKSLVQTWPP